MKQKFLVFLSLLLLFALCGSALAENVGVVPEVSVRLDQQRFNGPSSVGVTVTVTNPSTQDMAGACALYGPDGVRISDFGQPTLKAGESVTWSGTWQVTQAHLDAGQVLFALAYNVMGEDGVVVLKQQRYGAPVVDAGAEAVLEVTRTITPSTARNGQKVYVIYTMTNTGNADATSVTIQESSAIASSKASVGTIKPGETVTHIFTVTMAKKNLTSHATVTWKGGANGGSVSVGDATIKYADVKLTASVAADKKGGNMGDVVKLTVTLKNTGKKDIGNITVSDPVLGTIFSGVTVKAGETLTLEKDLTITSTADHIFTVSGTDTSGAVVETATDFVSIIAVDPAQSVTLSVTAEVDSNTIYVMPGVVKFTVYITNTSSVEATGVTLTAGGMTLSNNTSGRGITLAPGETLPVTRDVQVSYPGTFRFEAHATGQLGETLTFQSNDVVVSYAPPTATPTMAPIATPRVPVTEPVPQHDSLPAVYDTAENVLDIGFKVLLGITGLCLTLVVIGIIGRSLAAAKARNAKDNITRASSTDYTAQVPNRRRHYMSNEEGAAVTAPAVKPEAMEAAPEVEAESAPEAEVNMQESMNELYPEATAEEAPAAEKPADDEDATEGTYRRRRRTTQDE